MSQALKVIFITGRLYPWNFGGGGSVQYNLVRSISEYQGVEMTTLGTVPLGCNPSPCYPTNVRVIAYNTPGANDSISDVLASNFLYARVIKHIKEYQIVHFNILPGFRAGSFFEIARRVSPTTKFILNLHDIPEEVDLYSAGSGSAQLAKWHYRLSFSKLGTFDALVTNSRFIASRYEGRISQQRLFVIPNGVESSLFAYAPETNGDSDILSYGSIAPKKGGETLIRAFARSELARKAHTLMFVGQGVGDYVSRLQRLAKMLDVDDLVRFQGPLPRNKLIARISRSSFCVFPSSWEGFGIAILEAMALGKAVIATRLGGPSDFIEHGVDGLLINPVDSEELASSLDLLSIDSELRTRLARNARVKAKKYMWNEIGRQYFQLYDRLAKSSL